MLQQVDVVVLAIPSAYIKEVLQQINIEHLHNKKVISAIKGLLPEQNILLHEYLQNAFNMPLHNYFALMGPCHAEEVAAEKLSYLTIAGINEEATAELAKKFETNSIKVATSNDLVGVQYAAVLKNIYALGAGIAHGLDYGDNFLSVFIANSANEMVGFLKHHKNGSSTNDSPINYAASVYLGDLLVTCYSLHSRNRTFGNMIGKGYSVKAAQLEMNMVAEGYNASKCFYTLNKTVGASMPIAETIYNILHMGLHPKLGLINIQHLLH
jgi:glycerol-3-phosphate dehydrogenase (NAD(P)+)